MDEPDTPWTFRYLFGDEPGPKWQRVWKSRREGVPCGTQTDDDPTRKAVEGLAAELAGAAQQRCELEGDLAAAEVDLGSLKGEVDALAEAVARLENRSPRRRRTDSEKGNASTASPSTASTCAPEASDAQLLDRANHLAVSRLSGRVMALSEECAELRAARDEAQEQLQQAQEASANTAHALKVCRSNANKAQQDAQQKIAQLERRNKAAAKQAQETALERTDAELEASQRLAQKLTQEGKRLEELAERRLQSEDASRRLNKALQGRIAGLTSSHLEMELELRASRKETERAEARCAELDQSQGSWREALTDAQEVNGLLRQALDDANAALAAERAAKRDDQVARDRLERLRARSPGP